MSIYMCIDKIDEYLFSMSPKKQSTQLELIDAFKELRDLLQTIENNPTAVPFDGIYTHIDTMLQSKQFHLKTESKEALHFIINDLKNIAKPRVAASQLYGPMTHLAQLYHDVQHRFLYRPIRQGNLPGFGLSEGECYGFTFSMVDSELSPYKTDKKITLNRTVHNYQRNQLDRQKDQQKIKRTRLTRERFCPSLRQRAEHLYHIASKHSGEELHVRLRHPEGGHATYLSMQDNGDIRYMDPNHGAYLFKTKADFIAAYQIILMYQNSMNPKFHHTFYAVSLLKEDKQLQGTESKTWKGKLRSFLTGTKYVELGTGFLEALLLTVTPFLIGGTGAIVGAMIGSCFPGLGTVIGAIIGFMLSFIIGFIGPLTGHQGILCTFHGIKEQTYFFSEWIKKKLGIQRECDILPTLAGGRQQPTHSSTHLMINKFGQTNACQTTPQPVNCDSDLNASTTTDGTNPDTSPPNAAISRTNEDEMNIESSEGVKNNVSTCLDNLRFTGT